MVRGTVADPRITTNTEKNTTVSSVGIKMNENDFVELIQRTEEAFSEYPVEAPLWDRSRVDLLGPDMAIEVDWSSKWAEGVGQALYYGVIADRQSGLILLLKDGQSAKNRLYLMRAKAACMAAGVALFIYDCNERTFLNV